MASITQIRGVLLEEIVLYLLEKVGYRIVNSGEDSTRNGSAGLEIQGRGEWHQVDALAAFDYTPSFMYPLRLIVEAKCYDIVHPVQINVVRNSLGVLRDVIENYFTYPLNDHEEVQIQRFNYHSAIFSTSGYTEGAQRYAIAHQIFLIQYQRVPLIIPIVGALLEINAEHFRNGRTTPRGGVVGFSPEHPLMELRTIFRKMLRNVNDLNLNEFFTENGITLLSERILASTQSIQGSYYGMLHGRYPMHLLSNSELPIALFSNSDEILCRVHHNEESNTWSFVPTQYNNENPNFFELQFDLPEEIAVLLHDIWGNPEAIANLKRDRFSYLNIAGKIGGIRRQVRLSLDEEWLNTYIEGVRRHRE